MTVFSSDSKGVVVWGPTASIRVEVPSFSGLVDDDWVLENFSIGAREITDIRQCFNDVSFIYALGNNQQSCKISLRFIVFLGAKNCAPGQDNTQAIMTGMSNYKEARVSKKMAPEEITIGDFHAKGFLEGIDIGGVDASRSICYGTLHFILKLAG